MSKCCEWCGYVSSLFVRPAYENSELKRTTIDELQAAFDKLNDASEPPPSDEWEETLLRSAEGLYQDQFQAITMIDSKSEKIIQLDTLIMGGLFTLEASSGISPLAKASFLFFALSLLILVLSRRAFGKPARPEVTSLLPALIETKFPKAAVAFGLHDSVKGFDFVSDHLAAHLMMGTWAMLGGLLLLGISVIGS